MKLKINTILVVFFVALFSVGFSSLTAQSLYADSDNQTASDYTSVEDFESHVQYHLPASLVDYVVENYQDYSANQIRPLIKIANQKSKVKNSFQLKDFYASVETWIDHNVPPADRDELMSSLHSLTSFSTNQQ